jgi:hypothetical protein
LEAAMTISEARRAANRANARRSTGPRTEAGKEAARLNAVKHGLTARTPVLDDEDVGAFAALQADLEARLRPDGAFEREQVRAMAEAAWRMRRGAGAETVALQALIDKEEAGELGADEVVALPQLLLRIARYESHIQRTYERALGRLRQLRAARAAPSSPRARPGEDRAERRSAPPSSWPDSTPPATPGALARSPESSGCRRRREGNISQFPADNGFVSSFCDGPEEGPLKARLRTSCAPAALLGAGPPAAWRFAPALQGATVAPAREALPRAA